MHTIPFYNLSNTNRDSLPKSTPSSFNFNQLFLTSMPILLFFVIFLRRLPFVMLSYYLCFYLTESCCVCLMALLDTVSNYMQNSYEVTLPDLSISISNLDSYRSHRIRILNQKLLILNTEIPSLVSFLLIQHVHWLVPTWCIQNQIEKSK